MITIHLRYEVDPAKLADFAHYGRLWTELVNRAGGTHHGYFLPSEGDSDEAFALFSFDSFAAYGEYREWVATDPDCLAATEFGRVTGCYNRYERRFLTPLTSEM